MFPPKQFALFVGSCLIYMKKGEHKRWYDFIVDWEHLFLRNICSDTDLKKMKIDDIEKYYEVFDRLVELFPVVESALEDENTSSEFENFMLEDLDNLYSTAEELKETIDNVVLPKKRFVKIDFADKLISFIYSLIIKFTETDKIKGIDRFIDNLKRIMKNTTHVHHSHISGEIIGYAHSYCNYKVRVNQTKISVVAHNLFRFDFFFLLKELRAGVWKTRDITIGGKNSTNINFANISNRFMFVDIMKYFQQTLGKLAVSLTDDCMFLSCHVRVSE